MTREQFENNYAERSKITVETLREYKEVIPCNCGDKLCTGWASVYKDPSA